jgi:hypothetical protein
MGRADMVLRRDSDLTWHHCNRGEGMSSMNGWGETVVVHVLLVTVGLIWEKEVGS